MSKKIFALLLALVMLAVSCSAFAEGLTPDKITDEPLDAAQVPAKNQLEYKGARSSDQVSRKGGTISVTTEEGLVFSMEIPEDVYVLTQNYLLDIDLWDSSFSDPAKVVQLFIERSIHMNIFTFGQDNFDAYVYVYANDSIGAFIGDAINMTEDDADAIAQYLESQLKFSFDYGTLGNQVWFLGNNISADNTLWLFTWVNSCMIKVIVNVTSAAQGEKALTALSALQITVK